MTIEEAYKNDIENANEIIVEQAKEIEKLKRKAKDLKDMLYEKFRITHDNYYYSITTTDLNEIEEKVKEIINE